MLKKANSRLTDEQLSHIVRDESSGQKVFDRFSVIRADAVSRKARQYVNDSHEESTFFKQKRELLNLQEEVPGLKQIISGMSATNPLRDEYSHNLYLKERRIKKLVDDTNENEGVSFIEELVNYSKYEEIIETYDALAERIGKWFEAGNAGPGTITYNGISYTSPA